MKNFKEVNIESMPCNPFQMIGKDWALVTAKNGDKVNTMTISWGGMGVLWAQNVVFVFVRRSRYTKEFIDNSDHFSLTFFPESERKTLGYLGNTSGRDEDKIQKAGYHVRLDGDIPYFDEASTVLLCKKLSCHPLNCENMIDKSLVENWYSGSYEGNPHDMYVGAIEKVLIEE